MASVSFEQATRRYSPKGRPAVDALDLIVNDGEFLVLVGPSGCGKSTTLRMLAGLEEVSSGAIRLGDKDITALDPWDRDIAMVFQNYALYPHMTVAENMGFALKIAGATRSERSRRIDEAARLLEISDLLDRRPKALSGGQRQRVAMGRAIVRNPQVFLMDEPLSNLDAQLRVNTRAHISLLTQRLNTTTVYVTHDQTEAMTMGDRVAVLKEGQLQQVDTPRRLYERPENEFVARFIGSPAMNVLGVSVTEKGLGWGSRSIPVPRDVQEKVKGSVVRLGIRPEHLQIVSDGGLPIVVDTVEDLGADSYVHGHLVGEERLQTITIRTRGYDSPVAGELVSIAPTSDEHLHLFDPETGERLN